MPYMASCFQKVTGLRVTGLEAYTGWIKPGSYFHWVVAQKGQLGLCPHLAGLDPPRGPMMPPPCLASPTDTWEEQEAPGSDARSSGNRDRSDAHSSESRDEAPMETGWAGDGATWGDQMDAVEQAGGARKCCWSHSRR